MEHGIGLYVHVIGIGSRYGKMRVIRLMTTIMW